jgi:hypothetical protein
MALGWRAAAVVPAVEYFYVILRTNDTVWRFALPYDPDGHHRRSIRLRAYIEGNPGKWAEDRYHPSRMKE